MLRLFRLFLFLFLFWTSLWVVSRVADVQAEECNHEYHLKAAFLVNFAKFITWPEQALPADQQDFVLCVVGKDVFGSALDGVESKTVGGRTVRVVRVKSLKNVPTCQMLFISPSEADNLSLIDRWATGGQKAAVMVSDVFNFIEAGGHIQLIVTDNRLSFVVNHTAMRKLGLQANSSLLSLASTVY
ncbi:YfiR family protein [Desulfobulbus oligotrophicus]|uniref:YfiR family protein n=1 Tax=Desulfobulbus oligotrophicus TaxID=1909699 RepID=A0A7T6AQ29_9BACT|nr:YfiR family protein [Desulfobulbus oligotrophicus]QQG65133.1 YfiR family protein [Desulfobulbus oligotrophicus]